MKSKLQKSNDLSKYDYLLETEFKYGCKDSTHYWLNEIIWSGVDITANPEDWFKIACIIRDIDGERLRSLFHDISRANPNYSEEECDKMFDSALQSDCHYQFVFINHLAAKFGIDLT